MSAKVLAVSTLLATCMSVDAQDTERPTAGLWEVTTSMKAGFMGKSHPPEQRCLTASETANFDQFFNKPPASAKGDLPTCQLNELQQEGKGSAWKAQCDGRHGKIDGTGVSKFAAAAYDAKQTFSAGQMPLTMTTLAKRVGSC